VNEALSHSRELSVERDTSKYRIDGVRVPSVTEVLNIAGFVSFAGVPTRVLEEAAERGKLGHAITAKIDQGDYSGRIPPHVEPYVKAYLRFRSECDFEPELIEHSMVNQAHRFAGTLDRMGALNRHQCVLDLKCTPIQYAWIPMQLAGYEFALDRGPLKRFSLHLLPDGTYRLYEKRDRRDKFDFLAAVRVTHRKLSDGIATLED